MARMAGDAELIGEHRNGALTRAAYAITILVVAACAGALAVLSVAR